MKTDIITPKDLFTKDVHYIIPPFQRRYVWNQDDQWGPFWEDVRNVAENYLEELKRSGNDEVTARSETKPHFLAVVIKQIPTSTRVIEQRGVIDGQQRVTTLQLLLDAIQWVCEKSKHPHLNDSAKRLSKYVTNDNDLVGDDKRHKFKLWPTLSDENAFKHAMDNGLAVNDFKDSLIVQAHEFFQVQVRDWLSEPDTVEVKIDALETAVSSKLQMVVIDLNTQDDPNLIFETLNARGTPLKQSELIKNFVLAREGNPQSSIWGDLDNVWWEEKIGRGQLLRTRLDVLFNYWLSMRTGSEVPPHKVFDKFCKYVDTQNIRTVMADIQKDFTNYKKFEITGGNSPEEKQFHDHINRMQVGVITPVLLLLLRNTKEIRIRSFHALESFLVRRMICRHAARSYYLLFLELANKLRENTSHNADTIIIKFLREQTLEYREWPSDDSVCKSLEDYPLYRLLTRGRLRLILESVERKLRSSGKTEQVDVPSKITIEHLMPLGWRSDEWPLPDNIDAELSIQQRNTLIHSIGNLTLVTDKLNSSMSNSQWFDKSKELQNHTVLLLNKDLSFHPTWDENAILMRSKQIAKMVLDIWPGPDSKKWKK